MNSYFSLIVPVWTILGRSILVVIFNVTSMSNFINGFFTICPLRHTTAVPCEAFKGKDEGVCDRRRKDEDKRVHCQMFVRLILGRRSHCIPEENCSPVCYATSPQSRKVPLGPFEVGHEVSLGSALPSCICRNVTGINLI